MLQYNIFYQNCAYKGEVMIRIELSYKQGFILYYVMHYEGKEYPGGITAEYRFFVDEACPFKELMLRAIIDQCMDTDFTGFTAVDEWGIELEPFGFRKEKDVYVASAKDMKLPSLCKCDK